MLTPATLQTQAKTPLLADKHRSGGHGPEGQTAQIAVGMQDGNDKQRHQQKGQAVGQAVLIVDGRQQHQQQDQSKGAAAGAWHNENTPLVQGYAAGGGDAPGQPALQ